MHKNILVIRELLARCPQMLLDSQEGKDWCNPCSGENEIHL